MKVASDQSSVMVVRREEFRKASVSAGVAQIFNLLYSRLVIGTASGQPTRSGFQIRDTAECNSALRVGRPSPGQTEAVAEFLGFLETHPHFSLITAY